MPQLPAGMRASIEDDGLDVGRKLRKPVVALEEDCCAPPTGLTPALHMQPTAPGLGLGLGVRVRVRIRVRGQGED